MTPTIPVPTPTITWAISPITSVQFDDPSAPTQIVTPAIGATETPTITTYTITVTADDIISSAVIEATLIFVFET